MNGRIIKVNGQALTNARLACGLSLSDVAKALNDGVNKSSISRWEQGTLNPTIDRIEKLAKLYKTRNFISVVDVKESGDEDFAAVRDREIAKLHKLKKYSQLQLAKIFKVSEKTVLDAILKHKGKGRAYGNGE